MWPKKREFCRSTTWTVPPQPLVKNGVGVGVQQDEDGVVGGQVGLSARPVQEQVSQVVEAPHDGVVVAFGGAVAWGNRKSCIR